MIFFRGKTFNVRYKFSERNFLGETKVIQSWIHKNQKLTGFAANIEMRFSRSLSAGLCPNFDNSDYRPTGAGLERLGRKI